MNLTILMAVSFIYIIIFFFNSKIIFLFISNASHIIKLKFGEIKNTVRVFLKIKLAKYPVFLHNHSKFAGILLFVWKYINISLLLKMINGFS